MFTTLILLLILLFLIGILYYFGIITTRAGGGWLIADFSFPTRWEGKLQGSSGFFRRNFVIFRKYSMLAVEIETSSGALDFEITAPDGSVLSPVSGVYGQNADILIDVSRLKRCSVTLRTDQFNGQFHIALQ